MWANSIKFQLGWTNSYLVRSAFSHGILSFSPSLQPNSLLHFVVFVFLSQLSHSIDTIKRFHFMILKLTTDLPHSQIDRPPTGTKLTTTSRQTQLISFLRPNLSLYFILLLTHYGFLHFPIRTVSSWRRPRTFTFTAIWTLR